MKSASHFTSTNSQELTHSPLLTPLPAGQKQADAKGRRYATTKQKRSRRKQKYSRRLWSDEEDEAISTLVETYGTRRWTFIAKKLQEAYRIYGRSGKQCRER